MTEKNYVYIGTGEIKFLDKSETKLGAFFKVDAIELLNNLKELLIKDPNLKTATIYALPNKHGSYSVKLKTK